MDEEIQLCTFSLADMSYGLALEHVIEVSRCPFIVPVPSSHDSVAGLINLRGQIITTLDLRVRLGLPTRESSIEPMLVLCQDVTHELIGLQVDKIQDVISMSTSDFEPSPRTLTQRDREMVPGAYKDADRLIMLLELHAVLTLTG